MFKTIKLIIILLIIIFIGFWSWFSYQINIKASNNTANVIFIIKEGEGVNEISQNLFSKGIIKNKFAFETFVWFWGKEDDLIASRHNLNKNLSIRQLTKIITNIPARQEIDVTIIEGWNTDQIADYLEAEGIFSSQEFLAYVSSVNSELKNEYSFLENFTDKTLEGYLFPDTYRIYYDAEIEDLVKKTLNNLESKLTNDLLDEIARQGKSLDEVIILASIVEKEVATDEDRRIVAGIFNKRLRDYYPLQSDATVNYVTGKGMVQPTFADTEIDNPYNTYQNIGLPPGAISNPGLSSIEAVIYPNSTPYYFFLTTPEGEVIYSSSYSEHLNNKSKYLDK